MFTGIPVVVHNQHFQRIEAGQILRCVLALAEREFHGKLSACTDFAFHGNGSSEKGHQIFGNSHSEAGASCSRSRPHIRLFERCIKPADEFRTHPDTGIGNSETEADLVVFIMQLPYFHSDRATGWREFDGIGQNVEQDLVQTQRIATQIFLFDTGQDNIEIQPPVSCLWLDQIDQRLHCCPQIERLVNNRQFSPFNF